MILVTVGTQLPFDRLIKAVDIIAPTIETPVFAQIGKGNYFPKNMEFTPNLNSGEFEDIANKASVIVSHAGIGSIILAQRKNKPIIIFPRRLEFNEHRNDHQLATANAVKDRPGIYVANDTSDIENLIRKSALLTVPAAGEVHPHRRLMIENIKSHIIGVLNYNNSVE